ncbi:MAG: DNA-processing protein DprA [Anaerolineae bacterium]|nr:DNA-processing protein DprA [Anaerolineae bacterium]
MSTLAERAAWLRLLSDSSLPRRTAKTVIRHWSVEEARPLLSLWDLTPQEMQEQLALEQADAKRVSAIAQDVAATESTLRLWSQRGVGLVTRAEVAYPEMLLERIPEDQVPYFFFYAGDLAIATQPGIAVLGSGAPTQEAEALVRDLVGRLVGDGHHLVGGYARGVDRLAVDQAVGSQGQALIVLPLGFEPFQPALGRLKPSVDQGRMLILSPYALEEPYAERLADARLPLLAALSASLALVEPGPPEWAWLSEFRAWGGVTLISSGRDVEASRRWLEAGAMPFDDAHSAVQQIARLFGAGEADVPLEPHATSLSEVELPPFDSPQEALDVLTRGGTVPEALARRLRAMQADSEAT